MSEDLVTHPVSTLILFKNYIDLLKDVMDENTALQNHREITKTLKSATFQLPDEEDLNGAASALLRLQRVYKIKTADLVRGDVLGHKSSPLSADDCFRIGERATEQRDYKLAHSWLTTALENNKTLTKPVSVVLTALARVYDVVGAFVSAVGVLSEAAAIDPENQNILRLLENYKRTSQRADEAGRSPGSVEDYVQPRGDWMDVYEGLCRGDNFTELPDKKPLMCRYRPTNVRYGPVKEELFSHNPRIALLYDVISEHEADRVKELASNQLQRAKVGDPADSQIVDARTGKLGWLEDRFHGEVIQKLSRRVSHVTGLDTEYRDVMSRAEGFQVVNYGLAGQYEPHVDYYEDPEILKNVPSFLQNSGDRVATFMFYLNDVTAGGATVFTNALVRVPPVKGAAAFWYNSKKNGQYDKRTMHAGCPVLLGEKWVANKWIHEVGQEFRRPCGQSEDLDYTIDE